MNDRDAETKKPADSRTSRAPSTLAVELDVYVLVRDLPLAKVVAMLSLTLS
jgi:hypothetical protein